jgi:hypothetical protein
MTALIITVHGQTDPERSVNLRRQLALYGHSPANYEWHKGEPLYNGEPTFSFFSRQGIYFDQSK